MLPIRTSDIRTLAWPQERDACGVGFIADRHGRPEHRILQHALEALRNLAHRGAVSADGRTGDGAGVLTQIPHRLLQRDLRERGIDVPDEDLAVGVMFVQNDAPWSDIYEVIESVLDESDVRLLMWRDPPLNEAALGEEARRRRPVLRQAIMGRPAGLEALDYERLLYLTRKRIERRLADTGLGRAYLPSFSSRTVSYKGLMVADQLDAFYLDLADPLFETALSLFHQRYSTNTEPRWSLAQPFRMLAHNGEINTLQGNVNFMAAREPVLESTVWGDAVRELLPVVTAGASDSAALDNVMELLALSGRDPLHALAMMVPPAFEGNDAMDPDVRAFYRHHATLMEPWDGPAALAVSDGRYALAGLDRNGLRPQRYWIAESGLVVVGSEAGMLPLPGETILERGRLGPGEMLAVDTAEGRLLRDADVKAELAGRRPYRAWGRDRMLQPPARTGAAGVSAQGESLTRLQAAMGYSSEDYDRLFQPMVFDGAIPVGSMGDDTPLALLSEQPQQLWRYFKQRFAQVTNPPIDPYRERLVMSLETVVGPRGRLLEDEETAASVMRFHSPIIDADQLEWLRARDGFHPVTISTLFPVADGPEAMRDAVEALCNRAVQEVRDGAGVLILSDRDVDAEHAAIPALLATGAVHHRLLREGLRTRSALVVESGEPREDHHYACLIGYGAALVHPYLALASCRDVPDKVRRSDPLGEEAAVRNYLEAIEQGLLKIMSKMGISTISSYRGGQIFEAIGLDQDLIDRYFTATPSRLGGAGLEAIGLDQLRLHAEAFGENPALVDRGLYRFRKAGEYHALNPMVFKALHKAVRNEDYEAFEAYAKLVDERPATNLRDLLGFEPIGAPVPLDEVEPIEALVQRFTTQAMSHGSVSRETHETLSVAMNRLGAKSNSGEGGEDPARFERYDEDRPDLSIAPWHPKAGDWGNSAIKQVASGRFGVTARYLVSSREIEIKMAQGSKPGEGGQIPGFKVSDEIARIRHSVPGVTLISPPPHHDIYSIEDLAQLIHDLKRVHRLGRVGVKLVATHGVGTIASGVAKGYADNIQISGYDGGTGASPLSSVKHAGVPWELGLAETQRSLVENDLRGRVTLRVDGGMKTGRDVLVAALLGAEQFGFGTAALVSAGCTMIRQCHLNTCPVGVATQRDDLRKRYKGQPEHVVAFMNYTAQHLRMLLAQLGARSLDEVIGRTDLLRPREVELPRPARLDLTPLLADPDPSGRNARRSRQERNDRPDLEVLDEQVWHDVWSDLEDHGRSERSYETSNRNRTIGARLSGEIARVHGADGLPAGTVRLRFEGPVGQSFGAFVVAGMHLELVGEAQDYVGKGMSGGEIALRPPAGASEDGSPVTLLGNTVLYGATGGSLWAAGAAGERLAVRNSGAHAVAEGCGDHGCEYMTGGAVVVLGPTGRNFGAGMSGGVAYVLDEDGRFEGRYNPGMVEVAPVAHEADEALLRGLLLRHVSATGSPKAQGLLDDWERAKGRFRRIAPRVVEAEPAEQEEVPGLSFTERALRTMEQHASAWRGAEVGSAASD